MPDGTVVKVNRTILSDTSEDGNSYFFHSTSFHNVEQADDKTDAIDEVTEESEDKFEEFPIKENDEIPLDCIRRKASWGVQSPAGREPAATLKHRFLIRGPIKKVMIREPGRPGGSHPRARGT